MAKRNKHGRFIVTKQGLLLDTRGFGCRTWGMSDQKTIKFESGKYYLKKEYEDTNEELEIEVAEVLQSFEEIGKKYKIKQNVEVVICCGEMVFDKPIKVCKREYKKMNDLKIFTTNIEQEAINQIELLLSQEAFKDCKIRIMPDVHAGAGCVIGFTGNLGDKVIPNIVGVK